MVSGRARILNSSIRVQSSECSANILCCLSTHTFRIFLNHTFWWHPLHLFPQERDTLFRIPPGSSSHFHDYWRLPLCTFSSSLYNWKCNLHTIITGLAAPCIRICLFVGWLVFSGLPLRVGSVINQDKDLTFAWFLLCAKHCAKYFVCIHYLIFRMTLGIK